MKLLFKILILLVFKLVITHLANGQDQDTLFVFPSAAEIDVRITAEIVQANNELLYSYSIVSYETSEQNIYSFMVGIDSDVNQINSPENWRGSISDARKKVVSWGSRDSLYDVSPGSFLDGFSYKSSGLPIISSFYSRGDVEVPAVPYGEAPPLEATVGADIFENSFHGKTIGPKTISENTTNTELADTLASYLAQSCDLGWIENPGICRSLQANLENVKRQLEQGRTQTAANNLQAFLNEVEAIKDQHLSSEAYALLKYNGEYLLGKLREE